MPGQSRLFLDFCAGALGAFLPADVIERERPPLPAHWPELIRLLAAQNSPQNSSTSATAGLAALEQGAGAILTGQQVGLFSGTAPTPAALATLPQLELLVALGGSWLD